MATRDAMNARGPDGSGEWWSEDERCGLGHRRLSILDLSDHAVQPMVSDDRRLTLVFNGELQVRNEKCLQIPAVTHADGSGRLQTVKKAANPRY